MELWQGSDLTTWNTPERGSRSYGDLNHGEKLVASTPTDCPSLYLAFRVIQRNQNAANISSWRENVYKRRVHFYHPCTIKISIDIYFPQASPSVRPPIWVDSHESFVFGIGMSENLADSILLRDIFIASTSSLFGKKRLPDDFLSQDGLSFVISVKLSFDNEAAIKDVLGILDPGHLVDDSRQIVLTGQHLMSPGDSRDTVKLPLSLLSSNCHEYLQYDMIMESKWKRARKSAKVGDTFSSSHARLSETLVPQIEIEYRLVSGGDSYQFVFNTLSCPFCQHSRFSALEDLFMHFRGEYHTFLKFSLDSREVDETSMKARFSILLKQPSRTTVIQKSSARDSNELKHFHAQPKTYDEDQQYIREDLSNRERIYKSPESRREIRTFSKRTTSSDNRGTPSPEVQSLSSLSSPTDSRQVKSVSEKQRRKFRVPKAPKGVTFFRTATKRPLQEGELVSESDEELEQPWLRTKHLHDNTSIQGANPKTIEIIQLLDAHFYDERHHGDKFVAASLKRFIKSNRELLAKRELFPEFLMQVSHMMLNGAIDMDTIGGLLRFIPSSSQISPISIFGHSLDAHAQSEKMGVFKNSHMKRLASPETQMDTISSAHVGNTDKSQESQKLDDQAQALSNSVELAGNGKRWSRSRNCSCGKRVHEIGNMILCSNLRCTSEPFHLTCAGLKDIIYDWLCPSCEDAGIRHQWSKPADN